MSTEAEDVQKETPEPIVGARRRRAKPSVPKQTARRGERRADPHPRFFSTPLAFNRIENAMPDRHYVWANKGCPYTGVRKYLSMGYQVETHRRGGPKIAGMSDQQNVALDGQEMEFEGSVLMSIEKERREAIEQYGENYDPNDNLSLGGIERAEMLQERITARDTIPNDNLRGTGKWGTRHFRTQNLTQDLEEI
jgi:hypothetical protein